MKLAELYTYLESYECNFDPMEGSNKTKACVSVSCIRYGTERRYYWTYFIGAEELPDSEIITICDTLCIPCPIDD